MLIRYLGHSCFEIQTKGKTLLFDPFITGNPLAKQIDIQTLKPDYILLSHGHLDHVLDAEFITKNSGAFLISNYEIISWYEEKGYKGHGMNLGGSFEFDFGSVKYVQAVHSSVLPDGTYGGNPGGFIISNEEGRFYFAGDTALHMDMQLIPMTSGAIDWAILPIGSNFTMDYKDARLAADFIKCQHIIGCHYDTFGFIKIDKNAAQQYFSDEGKTLYLLEIDQTIEL
jgi:L-ascorbate metabolism protein UlaG (beta-lactamase superfamily)